MQEANAVSIEYFKDLRRVADLLNGIFFHGKMIIQCEDLQEQNPVIHNIFRKEKSITALENTQDLSIMAILDSAKVLFVLQLQTRQHYAMPVRVLHEKGTEYYNQWKAITKKHREIKDLKTGDELLSGMKANDRFYPVLHIIVYFGETPWNAAKNMEELFSMQNLPKELQELVIEKTVIIFEICYFANPEWFHTDLRQVCEFLRRTKDKNALSVYLEENRKIFSNLPEDTYNLLVVMAKMKQLEIVKKDFQEIGGKYDMCKAFDDLMADSEKKGENRMGLLSEKLIKTNRAEDLLRASRDWRYRRELMKEFGIV